MKFIALLSVHALSSIMAMQLTAQEMTASNPPAHSRENEVALFNGRDFSGWTFCTKDNADPLATWSITNGVIHCTGTPAGYIRTTQSFSNYFLTVEWRFVNIAPKADNGGLLVHLQSPDKIWPQCVQVQGKHDRQGDLFLMEGAEAKEHKGKDKNTPVPMRGTSQENPVGKWNKAEIICKNHVVSAFINGMFVNEITECTLNGGFIGFQSEGGEIEIRSVFFCPLKY